MPSLKLAVISPPNLPYLSLFRKLAPEAEVTIGFSQDELRDAIANADVILNGMNGGDLFKTLFPQAKAVRWVHSLSAGVENILTPGTGEQSCAANQRARRVRGIAR